MFDVVSRERKAKTMVSVSRDYLGESLDGLTLLDVGASTGIIDKHLSSFFYNVHGIDIDSKAVNHAYSIKNSNQQIVLADTLDIPYLANIFDVVICSQVYEHVPDAKQMVSEIHRVLKPGGVCFFAASNRLMFMEPHYRLPLLSVLPKKLANLYMKFMKRGTIYYEKHLWHKELKELVKKFEVIDYTSKIINNPKEFHAEYMLKKGTFKALLAIIFSTYFYRAMPGYIWLLHKQR